MSPKLRRFLILAHLWAAGFMAPAFALHAVSGGLYLIDQKGSVETEALTLPANAQLDFESDPDVLESDVRALLEAAGLDHDFDYIRNRGTVIQLRPTSRDYIEFAQTDAGLTAKMVKPDLVKSMLELHFGHGPSVFRTYQKFVAIALVLVVLGGILVGLLAKAYRRQTVIASVAGLALFWLLAFVL